MLLVFNVGADLGTTVKYTIQGLLGTLLAWLNMFFLDFVLRGWLGGGAYNQRHPTGQSSWLPLCHVQHTLYVHGATHHASCFVNIAWLDITVPGGIKAVFIMINFATCTALFLAFVLEPNTRVWALFTHVYFCMSFLNPTTDSEFIPRDYMLLILFAALWSPLCLMIPKPYLAFQKAERLSKECAEVFGKVLQNLPQAHSEVIHLKATSAFQEGEAVLADMEATVQIAWYEGFDVGRRRHCRQHLLGVTRSLRRSMHQVPMALKVAATLSQTDHVRLYSIPALQQACTAAHELLLELADDSSSSGSSVASCKGFENLLENLGEQFRLQHSELSPESHAFLVIMCGVLQDCNEVLQLKHHSPSHSDDVPAPRLRTSLQLFCRDFGRQFSGYVGHRHAGGDRYFVLRNSLCIFGAFLLGWLGFLDIVQPYDTVPATTICFILCRADCYVGSSIITSLKRLIGVITGKVVGSLIQYAFAVRFWPIALAYAISMWLLISFTFHVYIHTEEHSYVAFLACAYLANAIVPERGFKSGPDYQPPLPPPHDWPTPGPGTSYPPPPPPPLDRVHSAQATQLLAGITDSVIGCALLIIVDAIFAPKASREAPKLLQACFSHSETHATATFSGSETSDMVLPSQLAELRHLIPYAAAEPSLWRQPFRTHLFFDLEASLARLMVNFSALQWVKALAHKAAPTDTEHHSDVSLTLSGELLEPLFLRLQVEVPARLKRLGILVESVTRGSIKAEEQRAVRQELRSTLYTAHILGSMRAGAKDAMDQVAQSVWARRTTEALRAAARRLSRGGATTPGTPMASVNPCQPCGSLYSSASRDQPMQLEELLSDLQQQARRGNHPLEDGVSCLHFLIYLVKAVLLELHHMQLTLLDV